MSWSCDWEPATVYGEREVVGRAEYPCVECSAPILEGERHLAYRMLYEGSWSGGRQHLLCRDACVWIRDVMNGDDGCIAFGELGEWWANFINDTDLPGLSLGRKMYAMVRNRERLSKHKEPSP